MAGEEVLAIPGAAAPAGGGDGGGVAVEEEIQPGAGGGEGGTSESGGQPEGGAPAEGAEERLPGEPEEESGDFQRDGRTMDKATQKAIAALKKIDPQAARAAANAYFANQAVLKEFPEAKSVSDVLRNVRSMKATIESLGGESGIEEMQSEISDYRTEIQQFAEGDPALLQELYSSGPDAFASAITNGMDLLAEKNPEGFNKLILPHAFKTLQSGPLRQSIENMVRFLGEGNKGQEIYEELRKIGAWWTKLDADSKQTAESKTKTPDPEKEKFNQEREAFEREKHETFRSNVNTEVTKTNNTALAKITNELFNQLKLSQEGRREFTQSLMNRVWAKMKADKAYLRNAQSKMSKRDLSGAAALISDKFAEFLPEEFRKLRNQMYPHIPTRRAGEPAPKLGANGNKAPAAPAQAVLGKKPPSNEIDWTKTTPSMYNQGGQFGEIITVTGKRIKFKWAEV